MQRWRERGGKEREREIERWRAGERGGGRMRRERILQMDKERDKKPTKSHR